MKMKMAAKMKVKIGSTKMLEVGKTYKDKSGVERECIYIDGDTAWLKLPGKKVAHMFERATGVALELPATSDIVVPRIEPGHIYTAKNEAKWICICAYGSKAWCVKHPASDEHIAFSWCRDTGASTDVPGAAHHQLDLSSAGKDPAYERHAARLIAAERDDAYQIGWRDGRDAALAETTTTTTATATINTNPQQD